MKKAISIVRLLRCAANAAQDQVHKLISLSYLHGHAN